MTDIVERLRAQYDAWNNPPSPELPDGAGVTLDAAAEIERLRAALRFYADPDIYRPRAEAFGDGMYAPHVILDAGYNARNALKEHGDA